MDHEQSKKIKTKLEFLETNDLLEIWKVHNPEQWTEEAFYAIREILQERNVEIPRNDNLDAAKENIEQAEKFLEAENWYQALIHCNMAIEQAPHFGYAYYIKGLVHDEMGQLDAAIDSYRKALQFNPDLKEAQRDLNWALNALDQGSIKREERIFAALSHISILFSPGILVPVYIWATQKEKSRYVAFQSLQAIAFQLLAILVQFLTWMLSSTNSILSLFGTNLGTSTLTLFSNIIGVATIIRVVFLITGLCGSISTFRGKPFQYTWIGGIVVKYMRE